MIAANKKQLAKISWRKKQCAEMATAIEQYFNDNEVPLARDPSAEYSHMEQLARFYYVLKSGNKTIVANFEHKGAHQPMLMAHWYSRHRYCPVWNMRKSQLIRKKYRQFLQTHEVAPGRLLIREYTPIHMVLTVPHKDGLYQGDRFYARKLLAAFAEMRRTPYFKKWIYGGEYGLEIKKSKAGNGLHIHIHSLCFLLPGIKPIQFHKWLLKKWEKLTGATECHFEPLYFYKKDEKTGRFITDAQAYGKPTAKGFREIREERKKFYIDRESTVDDYLKGVMECIKYHFKQNSLKDEFDEWDVPLMQDILNNSINLRFYSRYGAFYKQPSLNFNNLDAKPGQELELTPPDFCFDTPLEDIAEEYFLHPGEDEELPEPPDFHLMSDPEYRQTEEYVMGNVSGVEETLLNPFTGELAEREDYTMCVVDTGLLQFDKNSGLKVYDPDLFMPCNGAFGLRDVIKAVCMGRARDVAVIGVRTTAVQRTEIDRQRYLIETDWMLKHNLN